MANNSLQGSALRPVAILAIAVAAISPTTSVFLVYGESLSIAGTGIIWAFAIGAVIALAMALCYAEVGSVFPSAGGAYTIVRRALGPVFGGVAVILFLLLGMVAGASILVAAATYLKSLVDGVPINWTAFAMMAVITVLSMERVGPTGWVTAAMLVLELAVILVFTGFAFAHVRLHGNPLSHPVLQSTPGGPVHAVGAAALLAAVVPALFAFNGYDWPLYFAEESRGSRRVLPRAVLLAAVISVVVEVLAVVAATFAVGNLGSVTSEESPLSALARQVMGSVGSKILLVGVVIAMFDTALAGNLGYARIYYAAARDRLWPGRVNDVFGHLSARSRVPVYGFAALFVGNGLLCIVTSLSDLITFTGVVIATIYLLVAVSAVVCRVRDHDLAREFRMPLWPLPPLIAIAGVAIALTKQSARDLGIALGVAGGALVVYLVARRRLPGRLAGFESPSAGAAADHVSTTASSARGPTGS